MRRSLFFLNGRGGESTVKLVHRTSTPPRRYTAIRGVALACISLRNVFSHCYHVSAASSSKSAWQLAESGAGIVATQASAALAVIRIFRRAVGARHTGEFLTCSQNVFGLVPVWSMLGCLFGSASLLPVRELVLHQPYRFRYCETERAIIQPMSARSDPAQSR